MTKGYEQRKAANERYLAKLDEIRIMVPKVEKDKWKLAASSRGKSLNQFIVDSVEKEMDE